MSKRVKPKRTDSFESEVQRRFGPVAKQWGLTGPVEGGVVLPTVKYHAGPLTYAWTLDDEDRAGLGAPQDVRTSAQAWLACRIRSTRT